MAPGGGSGSCCISPSGPWSISSSTSSSSPAAVGAEEATESGPSSRSGPSGHRRRGDCHPLDAALRAALLDPSGSTGGAEGPALWADHDHDPDRLAHRATGHPRLLSPFDPPRLLPPAE